MLVMTSYNDYIELIYSIRDKQLLEDFLVGITTPKERHELTQRVEIITRLLEGQPQSKIAKDLSVGIATVTRGSKELQAGHFKVLRKSND